MEIKKQFILREIAGDYILVPNGDTIRDFNGLITLNEMGGFIWDKLSEVETKEELLSDILEEYDVEESIARKDLDEFLEILKKAEILE